jgi:hypothetical protein
LLSGAAWAWIGWSGVCSVALVFALAVTLVGAFTRDGVRR